MKHSNLFRKWIFHVPARSDTKTKANMIHETQLSFARVFRWFCFLLFSAASCSGRSSGSSSSASGNYNYNPYNYDTTTPQFTPDGRLLQVEYASAAADHSSPLVVIRVQGEEEDPMLIFLTTRPRFSQQRRLVILEDPNDFNSLSSSSRPPSPTLVAMSGVLSDNLLLLKKVSDASFKQYRTSRTGLTSLQVTQTIADECQLHSFGGGIRPFGATMLVCGVRDRIRLYQTDSSGGILDGTDDPTDEARSVRWIVGGTPNEQRELRRDLKRVFDGLDTSSSVADILASSIEVMRSKHIAKRKQGKRKSPKDDADDVAFEVVIVSQKQGIYSLSSAQIEKIERKLTS